MTEIIPMTANFGADITGMDLNTITDADFELIYRAWLDYGVLRFRDQQLDEDGLQRFSQRFGPLEEIPLGARREPVRPARQAARSRVLDDPDQRYGAQG